MGWPEDTLEYGADQLDYAEERLNTPDMLANERQQFMSTTYNTAKTKLLTKYANEARMMGLQPQDTRTFLIQKFTENKPQIRQYMIDELRKWKFKKAGGDERKQQAWMTAAQQGVGAEPETIVPNPEQQEQMANRLPWYRTPEQTMAQLRQTPGITPEQMSQLTANQVPPDLQDAYDQMLAEQQMVPPDKFEPAQDQSLMSRIASVPMDVLAATGRGIGGFAAGLAKGEREQLAAHEPQGVTLGGLAEGFKGAVSNLFKRPNAPNFANELQMLQGEMAKYAADLAKQELPQDVANMGPEAEASLRPQLEARTAEIFAELSDKSGFSSITRENPVLAQLGTEIVLDPINYAGGALFGPVRSALGGVGKLAGKLVPKKVAQGAKAAFKYRSDLDPLEKLGPLGEELASRSRMASDIGGVVRHKLDSVADQLLGLTGKYKGDDAAKFMGAIKGELVPAGDMVGDVAKHRELADVAYKLRQETGVGQKIGEGGIVAKPGYTQRYVPEVLQEHIGPKKAGPLLGELPRETFRRAPKSTISRLGDESVQPVRDPHAQWTEVLKQEGRALESSAEIKHTIKALEDTSTIGRYTTQGAAEAGLEILQRETGIPMRVVGGRLAEKLAEAGNVGSKASKWVVMPEVLANRMDTLTKIVPGKEDAVINGLKQAWSYIRPLSNIARKNMTIARSLGYIATNTWGAVGINQMAHGLKAANANSLKASLAAFNNAFFDGDLSKLKNISLTLGDGTKKSAAWALDYARKIGVVGQTSGFKHLGNRGAGPFAKLESLQDKAIKGMRLDKLSQFGDDYQKFAVFVNALEGTSQTALAKAADYTHKWASNYNRLTPFEKNVMRDVVGFYSWQRFVYPAVARSIVENPQRLAVYDKIRKGMETTFGNQEGTQAFEGNLPAWIQRSGSFTAQPSNQPPDVGSDAGHDFAVSVIETPINTVAQLAGTTEEEGGALKHLSPALMALGEAVLLSNTAQKHLGLTKDDLKQLQDMGGIAGLARGQTKSKSLNALSKLNPLPWTGAAADLADLMWKEGKYSDLIDMGHRYRVGRDWLGLEELLGIEHVGDYGGITKTYKVNPMEEAARKSQRGVDKLKKVY